MGRWFTNRSLTILGTPPYFFRLAHSFEFFYDFCPTNFLLSASPAFSFKMQEQKVFRENVTCCVLHILVRYRHRHDFSRTRQAQSAPSLGDGAAGRGNVVEEYDVSVAHDFRIFDRETFF